MIEPQVVSNRRINRKKQKRRRVLAFLALFLLAIIVGVASFLVVTGLNPIPDLSKITFGNVFLGEPINILLLGVDAGDGNTRTDTMMVASLDPKTKTINIISIPRDTRIYLADNQPAKINAAHAIGGATKALEETEKLLGISIPYYIRVNFQGFKEVVDALGGVEINVEKRLYYVDRAGDTYIDIGPGLHKLNGQQALNYARFRHDALGDLGRVKRQQAFLQALASEFFKPENIIKWPSLIKEASNYVETNMTIADMTSLSTMVKGFQGKTITMSTIPGSAQYIDGISYFLPDSEGLTELVKEKIFRQGVDSSQQNQGVQTGSIKVEVLNGTNIGGQAKKLADQLREKGFVVVNVGNADRHDYNQNRIIDRTGGKYTLVQQVMSVVGNSSVHQEDKGTNNSDLTVIIGNNFHQ